MYIQYSLTAYCEQTMSVKPFRGKSKLNTVSTFVCIRIYVQGYLNFLYSSFFSSLRMQKCCAIHRHLYSMSAQSVFSSLFFFSHTAFMSLEDLCDYKQKCLMAGEVTRLRMSLGQKPFNYNSLSQSHVTIFTTLLISAILDFSVFVWRLKHL